MLSSDNLSKQTCLFIFELSAILLILTACNFHLFFGDIEPRFLYIPGRGSEHDYLSLLLHPFVHVSWYHFLLDAGAFIFLYICLKDAGRFKRMISLIFSGAMSFLFVSCLSAQSISEGFCGLSGIAHGLMAVYSLEMVANGQSKKIAFFTIGIVSLKSFYEIVTGQAVFMDMHLGFCGTPVPASHAGGVVGGIIGFFLFSLLSQGKRM